MKSPQIDPSANWYPELDSNTCALGGSRILTYPKEVNGTVIPAVTNTAACKDGFSAGYKNWCINHAVDCVENMTLGHFPDMMLKAHEQYNMGYKAANGSGNLCPIGENAAFCTGWYNNNGEDHECGDDNYNETIASHSPYRVSIRYYETKSNDKTSCHDWSLGL